MEQINDSERKFTAKQCLAELDVKIRLLEEQIISNDKKLVEKYEGYPKTSVLIHTYNKEKSDWVIYFTIISPTNNDSIWERIKLTVLYIIKGRREFKFDFCGLKSTTTGGNVKNIQIKFNKMSVNIKSSSAEELLKSCKNTIFWGIECENKLVINNLPDDVIYLISEIEPILKLKYDITLIEHLKIATNQL